MALKADGSLKLPIDINGILFVTHLVCCLIGLPLNIIIAMVIVKMRRLRCKPRNIFMLGIFNSNFLSLTTAAIEMAYFLSPNDDICIFYVSVVGLPYCIFFLNLLLALIDRYVAITRPLWYRDNVTVRGVLIVQLSLTALLSMGLKSVYIFQIVPLGCEIQLIHGKIVGLTLVTLFLSCVALQIAVYLKTRQLFKGLPVTTQITEQLRTVSLSTRRNAATRGVAHHQQGSACHSLSTDMGCTVSWDSSSSLTPMEIEATKTLLAGVVSLLAITGPLIIYAFPMLTCSSSSMQNVPFCVSITWLAPYFKELPVIHAVCQPILYLYRSDEFYSAISSRIDRIPVLSATINRFRPNPHPVFSHHPPPVAIVNQQLAAPIVNGIQNENHQQLHEPFRQFLETSL